MMSTKSKSTITTVTVNGVKYVPLSVRCEQLHVDYKRARRFARRNDGTIVGARKMFGKRGVWVVPSDTNIVLPDAKRFGAKPRDDGRQRYIVFMSPDEHTDAVKRAKQRGDDYIGLIIDPRARAKQRREQRKRDAAENDATK